jgi:flagellin
MGQVSGPPTEPGDPPVPALPGAASGLSLADLFAGGALNLVDGDLELAQKSVDGALEALNRARAGIGNHLKYVLGSGLNYLRIELENTVAAESMIRDADFAEEVSKLMRGQIMELASIRTFQLAKEQAFGVLALLG